MSTVSSPSERNKYLHAPDGELLAACRIDVFRGSGRGGQKRNRTESAVRITHEPSGIAASSDSTRSQHTNKRLALRKLRKNIALQWRCQPVPDGKPEATPPPVKSAAYPVWLAQILDALADAEYAVADTAKSLGISTSRLVRHIAADRDLWQTVNQERTKHNLPPLRVPR